MLEPKDRRFLITVMLGVAALIVALGSAGMAAAQAVDGSSTDVAQPVIEEPIADAPAVPGGSGLSGRVILTMRCDVPIGDDGPSCPERGFPTTLVIRTADGQQQVAAVPTDAQGNFSIALNPGSYLVDAPVAGATPDVTRALPVDVAIGGPTELIIRVPSGRPLRQP